MALADDWLSLFAVPVHWDGGVIVVDEGLPSGAQSQTESAFSTKWHQVDQNLDDEVEPWKRFQGDWYLSLYGYDSLERFAAFLQSRKLILDAGCGVGYKAAWMAKLAPQARVLAMDISESVYDAAQRYSHLPNLTFSRGNIAATGLRPGVVDFINCDQVLHHTLSPLETLSEFARVGTQTAHLNTYVYAKKALPRELLDDYFRESVAGMRMDEIRVLSQQLAELGRVLSDLDITLDVPAIPALGIEGGVQDLQRFIYWNFVKCFWNPEWGVEASAMVNFDWYAPSIAHRYSRDEFVKMCHDGGWKLEFLHSEPACWSGRFIR